MGGQGQQVPRTITLKELGLTGEAWMPLSISVVVFLVAALSGLPSRCRPGMSWESGGQSCRDS